MTVEAAPLPAGTVLGGYRVERLLGRGGMGEVYVATHLMLNKPVALKVLSRSLTHAPDVVQRFMREGRAAARVRHDHVIEVFDVGDAGGVPYLAMELLEGEPLAKRFAEGALRPDELGAIFLPVIAAVATAHEQGVVHRDLKPDNVFLRRDARGQAQPVVLDFGISKVVDEKSLNLTETRAIMGTPYYMSPEQARGAKSVTGSTDQYAIGVMLYEGATGRRPFEGESLLEIVHKISSGEYALPGVVNPALPAMLTRIIEKGMAKTPAERYPGLWALGAALLPLARARDRETWEPVFRARAGALESTAPAVRPVEDVPAPANPTTTMRGEIGQPSPPRRRSILVAGLGGAAATAAVAIGIAVSRDRRTVAAPGPTGALPGGQAEGLRPDAGSATAIAVDAGTSTAAIDARASAGGTDLGAPPAGAGTQKKNRKKKREGIRLSPDDF